MRHLDLKVWVDFFTYVFRRNFFPSSFRNFYCKMLVSLLYHHIVTLLRMYLRTCDLVNSMQSLAGASRPSLRPKAWSSFSTGIGQQLGGLLLTSSGREALFRYRNQSQQGEPSGSPSPTSHFGHTPVPGKCCITCVKELHHVYRAFIPNDVIDS